MNDTIKLIYKIMTVEKCPTHIRAFFVIQTFVYYFAAVTKLHIAKPSLTVTTVQLYSTGLNTSLAAPGALAHRLQRRTACNTSPPAISKMADGVPK